jgi:hypothetical protein
VPDVDLTVGDIRNAQRQELAEPESRVKGPARYAAKIRRRGV